MEDNGGMSPASNKDISKALKLLYNTWFKEWGDKVSDQRWDEMVREGYGYLQGLEQYPVVWNLYFSLLYELSARLTGGYTETTRNKILDLIKGGVYGGV